MKKKEYIFFCFILFILFACGNKKTNTDNTITEFEKQVLVDSILQHRGHPAIATREKFGLNGAVKKYIIRRFDAVVKNSQFVAKNEIQHAKSSYFDEKGYYVAFTFGSNRTITNYRENCVEDIREISLTGVKYNLKTVIHDPFSTSTTYECNIDDDDEVNDVIHKQYNHHLLLVEETETKGEQLVSKKKNKYNEQQQLVLIQKFDKEEDLDEICNLSYEKEYVKRCTLKKNLQIDIIDWIYNERKEIINQVLRIRFWDLGDKFMQLPSIEQQLASTPFFEQTRIRKVYKDRRGNVTFQSVSVKDENQQTIEFKIISDYPEYCFSTYEYDQNMNWVKEYCFDKEGKLESILTRDIVYYNEVNKKCKASDIIGKWVNLKTEEWICFQEDKKLKQKNVHGVVEKGCWELKSGKLSYQIEADSTIKEFNCIYMGEFLNLATENENITLCKGR